MESPKRDPFDVLHARGLFAQIILTIAVVSAIALWAFPWVRAPGRGAVVSIALYASVGLILVVRGRAAGLEWRRLFGPRPTARVLPLFAVIVPLILITFAAVWLVFVPLSYLVPDLVEQTLLAKQPAYEVTTIGQFATLFFVMVVAAPLAEETLYRGVLLHRWARRWGTPAGVALSSAAFAIGHAEWVGHFVIGMAFGAALSAYAQPLGADPDPRDVQLRLRGADRHVALDA
jgi:membrane protease YdiL (CAAX protease family)